MAGDRIDLGRKEVEKEKPLIIVKNVTHKFKEKLILSSIDLEIEKGDIFGVIGMSGAGKTTILQIIMGTLIPFRGEVLFKPKSLVTSESILYKSVVKERKEVRKTFGFSTQIPSFCEHLTVDENLKYYGALYGLSKDILKTNMDTLLNLLGLNNDRQTLGSALSGGMQKRLDIACALVHNPDVLILDEPTADLDPVLRRQMWELIRKINEKGTTIMISSHFLDEIEHLCTKIAILHNHRIIGHGSLEDLENLFKKQEEVRIRSLPGDYDNVVRKMKSQRADIKKAVINEGTLIIYTSNGEKTLAKAVHALKICKEKTDSIELMRPNLNEIFESLTKVRI